MLLNLQKAHIKSYQGRIVHLGMALVTHSILIVIRLTQLHLVQGAFLADGDAAAAAIVLSRGKHAFEVETTEGTFVLLLFFDSFDVERLR